MLFPSQTCRNISPTPLPTPSFLPLLPLPYSSSCWLHNTQPGPPRGCTWRTLMPHHYCHSPPKHTQRAGSHQKDGAFGFFTLIPLIFPGPLFPVTPAVPNHPNTIQGSPRSVLFACPLPPGTPQQKLLGLFSPPLAKRLQVHPPSPSHHTYLPDTNKDAKYYRAQPAREITSLRAQLELFSL